MTLQREVMMPNLQVGKARYDNQRILRIYDFYFTGRQYPSLTEKYDVCFATQGSLERIYWLPYILERWTGPLSIAIQLISEEELLIFNFYMSYLTQCHSRFMGQVVMHLVVPANLPTLKVDDEILRQWTGISLEAILKKGKTCPNAKLYLKYLMKMLPTRDLRKLAYKEFYPFNHMRNIGRKGCATHWTYSADVDIIPRSGTADMLQQFYNEHKINRKLCTKCAYVVPTFELNYVFPFPENKKKVVEYYETGAARPYHFQDYAPAQEATEYKYWTANNIEDEGVTISHPINQSKLRDYEPFYVSPDNIEPFDERFIGYGYDRSSQFEAAIMAGWTFLVITPLYAVHWGFQTTKTYEQPRIGGFGKPVREEQGKAHKYIYKRFVEELECKKNIGRM